MAATGANRRGSPAPSASSPPIALDRLEKLQLIARDGDTIRPLPALARFALGDAEIRRRGTPRSTLFDPR